MRPGTDDINVWIDHIDLLEISCHADLDPYVCVGLGPKDDTEGGAIAIVTNSQWGGFKKHMALLLPLKVFEANHPGWWRSTEPMTKHELLGAADRVSCE